MARCDAVRPASTMLELQQRFGAINYYGVNTVIRVHQTSTKTYLVHIPAFLQSIFLVLVVGSSVIVGIKLRSELHCVVKESSLYASHGRRERAAARTLTTI